MSVDSTPTASYSYDAADQVVGWGYDAAGNLLSDGATSYSYDALNHLTGASATGRDSHYSAAPVKGVRAATRGPAAARQSPRCVPR